jgi:hypothetical protein
MPAIVFVPGILGSRLSLDGAEIWPPSLAEAVFGHARPEALADPRAVAGDPIDRVACFDVYAALLDDLAAIARSRGAAVLAFGYDWRGDLGATAARLAERIEALPHDARDDIRFVGHSMGGLVVRLLLESDDAANRPWLRAVRGFVALAVPHRGTPTALVRALGLEGTCGLSGADIRGLAAAPGCPALATLLPAPGIAAVCAASADGLTPLDLWDPAIARRLGLPPENLGAALAVHRRLAAGRTPPQVATLDLAGSGTDGWARVDLVGDRPIPRLGRGIGDGSVPLWSAVEPHRPHHAAPAPHDKVFLNDEIRALLRRALGAAPIARPFGAVATPRLAILPTRPVFAAGRPIELLLVPSPPARPIDGTLVLCRAAPATPDRPKPLLRLPVAAAGGADPLLLRLDPPAEAGFYRVGFEGSHAVADEGAGRFVVAAGDCGGAP